MKLNPIPRQSLPQPKPIIRSFGQAKLTAPEMERIVRNETLKADREIEQVTAIIDSPKPLVVNEPSKLSRLVAHDFPFDESQLKAIKGLSRVKFGCMTGAAGTGKTTCTKAVVDSIVDQLPQIDMSTYFKIGYKPEDTDDDYEMPDKLIPGVALCAYTGRASQMIKKNFPLDWHGNIMTIHRLLAFYPVWTEDWDPETNQMKKKPNFIPTYNAVNKLPWKVIIIDEAGMLGLNLWDQLLAACTDDCRIIMIGDINQLPPTHGKSIFGFAMAKWPSWELTHIHRQTGENNSIVDNAWRVINGEFPKSDNPQDPNWKFIMMPIDADSNKASRQLRKWLSVIRGDIYDPIRDSVITPINAFKDTPGFSLGQDPLNRELAIMFNSNHGRYIIDAGRERKYFAVGDKVMATKNDHEAGITNGMTGIIKSIEVNAAYRGNSFRFGLIEEVNKYLNESLEFEEEEFSLDDLAIAIDEVPKEEKESRDRGPASHIVTVSFGHDESTIDMAFGTLAEVASLMVAYVVTCHKMQGGEAPFIVVICHQAHNRMLFREWLYTAITRASERCVVLYTRNGMASALSKQKIKGKTLAEKVESFNRLQDKNSLFGATMNVNLPEPMEIES